MFCFIFCSSSPLSRPIRTCLISFYVLQASAVFWFPALWRCALSEPEKKDPFLIRPLLLWFWIPHEWTGWTERLFSSWNFVCTSRNSHTWLILLLLHWQWIFSRLPKIHLVGHLQSSAGSVLHLRCGLCRQTSQQTTTGSLNLKTLQLTFWRGLSWFVGPFLRGRTIKQSFVSDLCNLNLEIV